MEPGCQVAFEGQRGALACAVAVGAFGSCDSPPARRRGTRQQLCRTPPVRGRSGCSGVGGNRAPRAFRRTLFMVQRYRDFLQHRLNLPCAGSPLVRGRM